MTNYNDGKWHGWNGGECPVQPDTIIEALWLSHDGDCARVGPKSAGGVVWESDHTPLGNCVSAFRVIKEHKENERTWSRCVDGATYRNVELKFIDGIPHVREVL